jgi:hypothetical protein
MRKHNRRRIKVHCRSARHFQDRCLNKH